jgi:hypothetical protein
MTAVVTPELEAAQAAAVQNEAEKITQAAVAHEAALRELMPLDYDDAVQNGIVDAFYFNPETGQDGLVHVLAGDNKTNRAGVVIKNAGFHHAPSGEEAWPWVLDANGEAIPSTRTTHEYKRREFEPYEANIVIGGLIKETQRFNHRTGQNERTSSPNSMFPKEYDAFMVAKGVAEAARSRNKANDRVLPNLSHGRQVVEATTKMRLIDGSRRMKVSLLLDRETGKIITAYPLVESVPYFKKGEANKQVFTDAGYRKK